MSEDKGIRKEGIGFPSRFRTGDAMVFRPLTAGMLTEAEAAARLGIHELTLVRWAEYAIIKRAAHNQHP